MEAQGTNKPSNPPAFAAPAVVAGEHTAYDEQTGMSLRDYFAAKAMQAYSTFCDSEGISTVAPCNEVAEYAYRMADAMLKQREEPNEPA